jgi:hypothetical protein
MDQEWEVHNTVNASTEVLKGQDNIARDPANMDKVSTDRVMVSRVLNMAEVKVQGLIRTRETGTDKVVHNSTARDNTVREIKPSMVVITRE